MHAYLAATSYKCADCPRWTVKVNILTLKPQCWQCFADHWCEEEGQLMVTGTAATQYLLSSTETSSLPCLAVCEPPFTVFVNRAHAEQVAFQRWGGLAGLEAEIKERRVKAEAHRNTALKEYKEKKAAALKTGTKVPSFPKAPPLLYLQDGGWATVVNDIRHHVLSSGFVGFSQKDAPTLSLRSRHGDDILDPRVFVICYFCNKYQPVPWYERLVYPSASALDEHWRRCEHNCEREPYSDEEMEEIEDEEEEGDDFDCEEEEESEEEESEEEE
jgi:hypothetical protein